MVQRIQKVNAIFKIQFFPIWNGLLFSYAVLWCAVLCRAVLWGGSWLFRVMGHSGSPTHTASARLLLPPHPPYSRFSKSPNFIIILIFFICLNFWIFALVITLFLLFTLNFCQMKTNNCFWHFASNFQFFKIYHF